MGLLMNFRYAPVPLLATMLCITADFGREWRDGSYRDRMDVGSAASGMAPFTRPMAESGHSLPSHFALDRPFVRCYSNSDRNWCAAANDVMGPT
jgi:hypothetical protein